MRVFLPLLLAGCAAVAPPPESRSTLNQQILRFRTGYSGLTNRGCSLFNVDHTCQTWDVKEYVLTDDPTRALLIQEGLYCEVAGKDYQLCTDSGEQLCHNDTQSYKCGLFGLGTCHRTVETRIPVDAAHMAELGVVCASHLSYPFGIESIGH